MAPGTGGKAEKGDPKGKKGAKKDEPSGRGANLPDPTVLNSVRAALFSTEDRAYLIVLAGPEKSFLTLEPKFDDVLKSIKLNLDIQKK